MQRNLSLITALALSLVCALSLNAAETFDRSDYFGQGVRGINGKLDYVEENPRQTHSRDEFVWVTVSNFAINDSNKNGRIRVVIWNKSENFADPSKRPFRAASFSVTEAATTGSMKFKLAGLVRGQNYGFFAHFDENGDGELNRSIFGVPTEPYMFSNKENQGTGAGLKTVGFFPRAPNFDETNVTYKGPGQAISLAFY